MNSSEEFPILVLDNDPDTVMKISLDLRLGCYQTYSFSNMELAIESLSQKKYAAIIFPYMPCLPHSPTTLQLH